MTKIAYCLIIILLFSACSNSHKKENINAKNKLLEIDSTSVSTITIMNDYVYLDIDKLKERLDSFIIATRSIKKGFTYHGVAINEKTDKKYLKDFEWGIFDDINYKNADTLIRHHFIVPHTRDILRIFLLEIIFENELKSQAYFKEIIFNMNTLTESIIITTGEHPDKYHKKGLTGATDYVLLSKNKVFWYNLGCYYNTKEIEYLKNILHNSIINLEIKKYIEEYCGSSANVYINDN